MIKLTDILNEFSVNNPNITPEKVYNYWAGSSLNEEGWTKYIELRDSYCNKINIDTGDTRHLVYRLSKSDLNRFYNDIQILVQKYST